MPSVDNGREIISTTLTAQVHAIESMIHQTLPLFIQIFADVYNSSVLFALPLAIPIRISHLYHAAALDHAPYVVRASRLIRYMSCKPSFRWLRTQESVSWHVLLSYCMAN